MTSICSVFHTKEWPFTTPKLELSDLNDIQTLLGGHTEDTPTSLRRGQSVRGAKEIEQQSPVINSHDCGDTIPVYSRCLTWHRVTMTCTSAMSVSSLGCEQPSAALISSESLYNYESGAAAAAACLTNSVNCSFANNHRNIRRLSRTRLDVHQ